MSFKITIDGIEFAVFDANGTYIASTVFDDFEYEGTFIPSGMTSCGIELLQELLEYTKKRCEVRFTNRKARMLVRVPLPFTRTSFTIELAKRCEVRGPSTETFLRKGRCDFKLHR